jgi:hypothetical protein
MFRAQTAATEEDLAIMKAQYAATQDLYEKRIRYLEGRIQTLKTKLKQVEERRSLELEGYTNDVKLLRTKLRTLEQTVVGIKAQSVGATESLNDPSIASTSPSGSSSEENKSPSKRSATRNTKGANSVPQRLAKLAIVDDDVQKLQQELVGLARRLSAQ